MTDSIKTPTAEQAEIASLRAHNSELLGELKKAKAQARDAQAAADALVGERDAAKAAVQRVKLETPVAEAMARVAQTGLVDVFSREFGREFTFALDGDDIVIRDAAGEQAFIVDGEARFAPTPQGDEDAPIPPSWRPAKPTEADIKAVVLASKNTALASMLGGPRARGTGAYASYAPSHEMPDRKQQPEKPAPKPFGLR